VKVFSCFVDLCIELGLYGKELIVIDGTKVEASALHYYKGRCFF
jgi:transposase